MRHLERARVAVISLHTSPLDPPGTGDSGGMNVHIRETMVRLADHGVEVDVFTRCAGRGVPEVEPVAPGVRVIQVPAGPCARVEKERLPALLPMFARSFFERGPTSYDLVHAHYWLSGHTARAARRRWRAPLVASFHTLARVKDAARGPGEQAEPEERVRGEASLLHAADRVIAPTPVETGHLIEHYGAPADRLRVVAPGVDRVRFRPRPSLEAKLAWGLADRRVALFVGRLQPHKGPDMAVRAVAAAVRADPAGTRDLELVVAGGPGAASASEPERLRGLARAEGIADRVRLVDSIRHDELPWLYAAADVVLVPSRSESFGLVALEAQASGVPVVAAAVGGLPFIVEDGVTGFLVGRPDPREYAARLVRLLAAPQLGRRMGMAAASRADRFPWEATTSGLVDVYGELVPALGGRDLRAAP